MNVTFKAITDKEEQNNWNWGSKICNIGEILTDEMSAVLTYGRLLKLFGNPAYTSDDLEEQYTYFILGTDEDGNTYQFTVYSGPTGPAIGGDSENPKILEVAKELEKQINASDYVDYDYEGTYEFMVTVRMGIRNGEPYMEEEEMEELEGIDPGDLF